MFEGTPRLFRAILAFRESSDLSPSCALLGAARGLDAGAQVGTAFITKGSKVLVAAKSTAARRMAVPSSASVPSSQGAAVVAKTDDARSVVNILTAIHLSKDIVRAPLHSRVPIPNMLHSACWARSACLLWSPRAVAGTLPFARH